jgi:NAD(P)H-flavin reductase/ferredoxin
MIHPDNRIVAGHEGETLLESALREDIAFPFDCRNGGCGVCKCTLLSGRVDYGIYQRDALSPEEIAAGKALACCAVPLSDVELEYVPVERPGGFAVQRHRARVESLALLTDDVMRVRLTVVGEKPLKFYAGQYINVLLDDGEKRSFSFATAPHQRDVIELQIRLVPGGRFTTHVFNAMKVGDVVEFEGPLGSFFLREEGDKPIIFVAGATGFAPVKSMLEHAFHTGVKRDMVLYWGVRSKKDLYLPDLPVRWAAEHPNFASSRCSRIRCQTTTGKGVPGSCTKRSSRTIPTCRAISCTRAGRCRWSKRRIRHSPRRGLSPDDCFSDAFRLAPHREHATPAADLVRLGGTPT